MVFSRSTGYCILSLSSRYACSLEQTSCLVDIYISFLLPLCGVAIFYSMSDLSQSLGNGKHSDPFESGNDKSVWFAFLT
uniref:Uncharacterized protein n=1 Tax=Triticum urartu TaxID=4572 RepID=A0A8R7P1A8_TRIUA